LLFSGERGGTGVSGVVTVVPGNRQGLTLAEGGLAAFFFLISLRIQDSELFAGVSVMHAQVLGD
jgi:hypothetical protein